MRLGMVGLGKMGGNMARRLMKHGHDLVVFDVDAETVKSFEGEGAAGAQDSRDFVGKLNAPRAVCCVYPRKSVAM